MELENEQVTVLRDTPPTLVPIDACVLENFPELRGMPPEGSDKVHVFQCHAAWRLSPEVRDIYNRLRAFLAGGNFEPSMHTAAALMTLGALVVEEINALVNTPTKGVC